MSTTTAMVRSTTSRESDRLTLSADEALWVAEALSAQIEAHRSALDHRVLFSAAYNRKLAKKIEVLDLIRGEYLDMSAAVRIASKREDS